jgi:hypothetical protein
MFNWNFRRDYNFTNAEVYGLEKSLSHWLATLHIPSTVVVVYD